MKHIVWPTLALLLAGCANPLDKTADKLDVQTQQQVAIVAKAAVATTQHIEAAQDYADDADDQVIAADEDIQQVIPHIVDQGDKGRLADAHTRLVGPATQPSAHELLVSTTRPSVKTEHAQAVKAIAVVAPATQKISVNSKAQAQATHKATTALKAERSHFFSFKQRTMFYILLALLPIIGIVVFAIKVGGGGPILQALGEAFGAVISAVTTTARFIGKALFHVVTLGGSALADKVNAQYDAAAKTSASAVPVPAPVTPETPPAAK